MILKHYQTEKINFDLNKIILFYGNNEGLKSQEINNIIKKKNLKFINMKKKILLKMKKIFSMSYFQTLFLIKKKSL